MLLECRLARGFFLQSPLSICLLLLLFLPGRLKLLLLLPGRLKLLLLLPGRLKLLLLLPGRLLLLLFFPSFLLFILSSSPLVPFHILCLARLALGEPFRQQAVASLPRRFLPRDATHRDEPLARPQLI